MDKHFLVYRVVHFVFHPLFFVHRSSAVRLL
nr:MAG TPA: hypothetical protein [Caudoviricetes sp.]